MSTNPINNNKIDKKITPEQTIILIRLIKKYKCLWNVNSPDFRNRSLCNELYNKIGGYFQIPGEEVRRKFRRLRNCYMQEIRLMRNERKEYTNLFYFDEMEFLKAQIEDRLIKHSSPYSTEVSGVKEERDICVFPIESFEECYTIEKDDNLQFNNETEPHSLVFETETTSGFEDPNIEGSVPGRKTDEFHIFAEFLASQLREMDKLSALETMDELQRIVSHRRIKMLKEGIQTNTNPNSQSHSIKKSKSSHV